MTVSDDEWRLIALVSVAFIITMFLMANEPSAKEASTFYAIMGIYWVGLAIYVHGSQGIGSNWRSNVLFGFVFGGLFVFMHTFNPTIFRLGYPAGIIESARFWVVGIVAPIMEEVMFRQGLYLWILRRKLTWIPAAIICSIIFAIFHWAAYGLGSASAAYLGAFTFSILACYVTERTGDCLASSVMHMVVNMFLLISPLVVVGT